MTSDSLPTEYRPLRTGCWYPPGAAGCVFANHTLADPENPPLDVPRYNRLHPNYSTPMIPRAATLDRKWNEAANSLFDKWADRADFTGRFDFWDLQRLGSFYLDTDGEPDAVP